MDTRDLRYFIAAAEAGHLHRAAARIGRSQPALTKCIRRLEAELGDRLFEPSGRGIRLTATGHALLARARGVVQTMGETVRDITAMAEGEAGHVRIGTGPTTAEWLLPGLFRRLLAQSPGLSFSVTTGLGGVLRQALREGRLDLAVTPLLDSDEAEFTAFAVTRDVMVVAARAGHELDRAGVSVADLAPYGWLLPATNLSSTSWLLRTLQASGLQRPRVQVEADTVTMLRRVVAQTDLLTFLSRRDLAPGGGGGLCAVAVPGLTLQRYIGVLLPRGNYTPPAAQRVATLLHDSGEAIMAEATAPPRD